MELKKLIGYQIVDEDTYAPSMPDGFYSFQIIRPSCLQKVANKFFRKQMDDPVKWVIIPIYEGDVEEPTFIGKEERANEN